MEARKPIIFFDGFCNFCDKTVNKILEKDITCIFLLAPLQGETATKLLPEKIRSDLNTLVVWEEGKIKTRSEAVLYIYSRLGGNYPFLLRWVCRDWSYRLFSKSRYLIWGKRQSCRVPTVEERRRFLP